MCKRYVKENKDPKTFESFEWVKCLQNQLNSIIESNKQKYYSRLSNKLIDQMTSSKIYWPTLKVFLNNKKVPCISPCISPILKRKRKYSTPSLLSNALWWITPVKTSLEIFKKNRKKLSHQYRLVVMILPK